VVENLFSFIKKLRQKRLLRTKTILMNVIKNFFFGNY